MLHTWEEEMQVSYSTGLLMWHCFCDEKGVSKQGRALATQALLSVFVAHLATTYLGKTISGYMNSAQAWHILHSLPWALEKKEMDTMLCAAKKLTPNTSRRKKHCPYTPGVISAIQSQLDLDNPPNTAVFMCLVTYFYASARLGKFTMRTLNSFNPKTHITTWHLSYNQDRNRFKEMVLHLPRTKAAGSDGKDVYWASQDGDTDPTTALEQHL